MSSRWNELKIDGTGFVCSTRRGRWLPERWVEALEYEPGTFRPEELYRILAQGRQASRLPCPADGSPMLSAVFNSRGARLVR